jgi:signal transduction histidine kinase
MLQMENDNSSLRTTDAMPDLTEIVGTLSHELRTPLATIKGYTATLLRSAQRLSLEEQQEFLQTIAQATEHLEIVTTRMIDLARLEAGDFPLEMGAVDMLTLVQEAIAVARQWVPAPLQE